MYRTIQCTMYCKHCTCTHCTVSCINIYNILGKYTIITNPPPSLLVHLFAIALDYKFHPLSVALPSHVRGPAISCQEPSYPLSWVMPSSVRGPAISCQEPCYPLSGAFPSSVRGPANLHMSGSLSFVVRGPAILCQSPCHPM